MLLTAGRCIQLSSSVVRSSDPNATPGSLSSQMHRIHTLPRDRLLDVISPLHYFSSRSPLPVNFSATRNASWLRSSTTLTGLFQLGENMARATKKVRPRQAPSCTPSPDGTLHTRIFEAAAKSEESCEKTLFIRATVALLERPKMLIPAHPCAQVREQDESS